jgi:hypothetical protein
MFKLFFLCWLALIGGCTSLLPVTEPAVSAAPPVGKRPPALSAKAWQHMTFPGKTATQFSDVRQDGRRAVLALAGSSASMLRHPVRIAAQDLGLLTFSWKVPALMAQADLTLREKSDSPVRLVLAFEGDRSLFSAKNAMLSELSHALTGEPMPYATLIYVWSNTHPVGTVINSTRTDRIRKLVLVSGAQGLNQWLDYERDMAADFELVFGEAPGALLGLGIMTDSDNTRSSTQAWYGPIGFAPRKAD